MKRVVNYIYKSRTNVLNILESTYQYDVSDYNGFSINEVDTMYTNSQLDMLLTDKITDSGEKEKYNKTYIKYHLNSTLNSSALGQLIDDLYVYTDTLSKDDCLYVITDNEPNDSLINYIKYVYENDSRFIVVQFIKRLQFNILDHTLIPKTTILSKKEEEIFKNKYFIEDNSKIPQISRFDPLALAICLRPGQICKHTRNSPTAMNSDYYRDCV